MSIEESRYIHSSQTVLTVIDPNDCGRLVAALAKGDNETVSDEDTGKFAVLAERKLKLPPTLPLSAQQLSSQGIFLLDTGCELLLWIGRAAATQRLQNIFASSLDGIDTSGFTWSPSKATMTTAEG